MSFLGTLSKLLRRKPLRTPSNIDDVRPIRATQVYNLLQPGANDPYWARSTSADADATTKPDTRAQLRQRARLEMENSSYARGVVDTLANECIGSGPHLQIIPPNQNGQAAANRLERVWNEWAEEIRLAERLRTAKYAKTVDGEAFGVLQTNGGIEHPVKLDWRLYEADYFQQPWDYNRYLAEQNLRNVGHYDGIDFDVFGNPIFYWKTLRHPGSEASGYVDATRFERVAAQYVTHLYKITRPGQHRGVSEIQSVLNLFADMRDYTESTVRAADNAARISAVMTTDMPVGEADEIEGGPCQTIQLPKGGVMNFPDGWDMKQLRAEQPVDMFRDFANTIIREMARCLNMPFNIAAGDSSEMNYASGRLDHQVFYRSLDVERRYIERKCLNKIWREWFGEAVMAGVVPRIGAGFLVRWQWDGRPHVDPQKEAMAVSILKNAGLLNVQRYVSERYGQAMDEFLDDRAGYEAALEQRGLQDETTEPNVPTEQTDE